MVDANFYNRMPWRRLRLVHLSMEPCCRICAARGWVVVAREVDHIKPLEEGGEPYDHGNLQSLCGDCHKRKTLIDHGARPKVAFGTNGLPLDSHHHWNSASNVTKPSDV